MKNQINVPSHFPKEVQIDMLETLLRLIKEDKENFIDCNFKTNLQINYYRTGKNIIAKIMKNIS